MRRRERLWSGFVVVVISIVFAGWLSLLPWAARMVPDPWNWLSIMGWAVVLLPVLMFIAVVILRRLERRFLPESDRELGLES